MIRLAGYEPETDIAIEFTQPRPGEKLSEVPNLTHPKMTFIVDPDSRTVEAISVPAPAFCE
jgi:FlaA1/EpsC-like NDP-sugar epimerase